MHYVAEAGQITVYVEKSATLSTHEKAEEEEKQLHEGIGIILSRRRSGNEQVQEQIVKVVALYISTPSAHKNGMT